MNETIRAIARRIHERGGRALLVGGCVRDALLGRPCGDVDCEVHGIGPDALRALLSAFGEIEERGGVYGIYTLRGAGLDFALPRRERRTGPGHRDFAVEVDPFLSPEEAAARRDFTVNAVMRDALTGEHIDPFGGMADLQKGVLRAVPGGQFEEDPLRVLRGAQFAARFHLEPDEGTLELMRRMPTERLSAARVTAEMRKALRQSDQPDVFFRVLAQAGALEPWFAELAPLRRTMQNPRHHPEGDAFEHTMRVLREAAALQGGETLMLSCLCHDLGKAACTVRGADGSWTSEGHERLSVQPAGELMRRLGWGRQAIAAVQNLCALHTDVHRCFYTQAPEAETNLLFDRAVCADELARLAICDARGTGKPRAQAGREAAFVAERLAAYARAAARPMPDAARLMEAGVAPGPALKEALACARRRVLSGDTPDEACAKAAQAFKHGGGGR